MKIAILWSDAKFDEDDIKHEKKVLTLHALLLIKTTPAEQALEHFHTLQTSNS